MPPPPLPADSPYDFLKDPRYQGASVPKTESLKSTLERVRPYWEGEIVPHLKAGGPIRWIGTRSQIKHMAKELGLHGHIYYAPPAKGFEYIQSLLGHTAGASPVRGAIRLAGPTPLGTVKRGQIVEITLTPGRSWRRTLDWLTAELRGRGYGAVTVTQLEHDKA